MNKNKSNKKKGFTLIEMLIAVLMLSILVAIAVPTYMRSVEKSRTYDPINTLKSIAKAEQIQKHGLGKYTNQTQDLVLELRDYSTGNTVVGDTFQSQFFDYKVYGEDEAAATATRKSSNPDDVYELSVDYGTGELFCRPATNKTCIDLNLEEGRKYGEPDWEICNTNTMDESWSSAFNVSLYNASSEGKATSCQMRVNNKTGVTDFDFCFDNMYQMKYAQTKGGAGFYDHFLCTKGYISEEDKEGIIFIGKNAMNGGTKAYIKNDGGILKISCYTKSNVDDTCRDGQRQITFWGDTAGSPSVNATCKKFNSENKCTQCTGTGCSLITDRVFPF